MRYVTWIKRTGRRGRASLAPPKIFVIFFHNLNVNVSNVVNETNYFCSEICNKEVCTMCLKSMNVKLTNVL